MQTLGEVLKSQLPPGQKVAVSSVKANIGHTLEAAGIAGLIKTVLCMQHRTIPPAINIRSLSSKVDWSTAPYYIPRAATPWEAPASGQPRRAACNAFGIGGLNMHVVLDEYTESAKQLVRAPQAGKSAPAEGVAIIGIGCIFPGSIGLPKFWETLVEGRDPKTAPLDARWSQQDNAEKRAKLAGGLGGFMTDFTYDWRKHKVPPKQVAEADPLQFMLLEAAEQALTDAGFDRSSAQQRERCGVIVGTEFGGDFCDQLEMGLRIPEMQQALTGLLKKRGIDAAKIQAVNASFSDVVLKHWPALVDETGSFTSSTLASRVTKTLDLSGGAVAVDSGSTSSLSALALCCDMLLAGDNDMMICAGGQRRMGHNGFDSLRTSGRLTESNSPRNILDAGYDGIVPAEGVGVVVLKRLSDARRDGDKIHAVICGVGMAHHASHSEALQLAAERRWPPLEPAPRKSTCWKSIRTSG